MINSLGINASLYVLEWLVFCGRDGMGWPGGDFSLTNQFIFLQQNQ